MERLGDYRHSSYWYLGRPAARPGFLKLDAALEEAGGLSDTPEGWRSYADYLAWQVAEGTAGKNQAYVSLSQGRALGSEEFTSALIQDHQLAAEARAWESVGAREVREARWTTALDHYLRQLGKTAEDARQDRKSASWKVAIALQLKETTQVGNRWLAEHLNMGRPEAVSVHVGRLRSVSPGNNADYRQLTTIVST